MSERSVKDVLMDVLDLKAQGCERELPEGMTDTPARWARAMAEMTVGYAQDPKRILSKTFDANGYDQIVVLKDIDFVSLCQHHLFPFIGRASVAYLPGERVVGLSKLARVVDCFAKRLQLQELMTKEIADAIVEHLAPLGVLVVVRAQHGCLSARGAAKHRATMLTSDVRGVLRDSPEARHEALALLEGGE